MLNDVKMIGRLGRDAESRSVGVGSVTSFSIAVGSRYKDRNGDWQEKTLWINVAAWGAAGEKAADLRKGQLVFVSGELEQRKWTNREGTEVASIEINARLVMPVEAKSGAGSRQDQGYGGPEVDDDIPF